MKNIPTYDLIVIGGGPSGMMAAGRAASFGASVLLLERNKTLGEKLVLTGGGRCNITNAEYDMHAFLDNFTDAKQFLYSPFSQFFIKETFTFFEKLGLPLVIEGRKRAFPRSQRATDVLRVLIKYMHKHKVEVRPKMRVASITKNELGRYFVKTKDLSQFQADHVVVATGGLAAPETGSTGDGLSILEKLGHNITKPNPNIVPLVSPTKWIHDISGLSISFMTIRFSINGKIKLKRTGKILFTHFGVSGPLILNCSHEVKKLLAQGNVEASIDLFPDTEENELDRRVWRLFEKNKNKKMRNVIPELIHKNLSKEILNFDDINIADRFVQEVTKEERKKLVKRLKDLSFPITGTMGFERAVIADGGVSLKEVNFKTMSSTLHPNLYLLGDLLNINRPSGGFSLQLCWTTGWIAGTSVGNSIKNKK